MNFVLIRVKGDIKGAFFSQLKDNEAYVDIDITVEEAEKLIKVLTHRLSREEKHA